MLVLSRKPGQSLVIDGDIVVRVLESRGNVIRLGIEAPDNVRVLRAELTEQKPTPVTNETITAPFCRDTVSRDLRGSHQV
jgi:carbon storage regulator